VLEEDRITGVQSVFDEGFATVPVETVVLMEGSSGPATPFGHEVLTTVTVLTTIITLVVGIGVASLAEEVASTGDTSIHKTIVTEDSTREGLGIESTKRGGDSDGSVEVDVEMAVEELGVTVDLTLHHEAVHTIITSDEDTSLVILLRSSLATVAPVAVDVLATLARRQIALTDTIDDNATAGLSKSVLETANGVAIDTVLGTGPVVGGESLATRVVVAISETILALEVAITGLLVEELRVIVGVADAIRNESSSISNINVADRVIPVSPEVVAVETIAAVSKLGEGAIVALKLVEDSGPLSSINLRTNVVGRSAEEVRLLTTVVGDTIAVAVTSLTSEDAAANVSIAIAQGESGIAIADELGVNNRMPIDVIDGGKEGILKSAAIEEDVSGIETILSGSLSKNISTDGVGIVNSTLATIPPVLVSVNTLGIVTN